MGMIDVPNICTMPYDTVIKEEKDLYKKKHRSFNDSYILDLTQRGFRTDEIAKIIGRSEAFVVNRKEAMRI